MIIAAAESAITSMQGELHRQEKAVVGYDLQLIAAREAAERVSRKEDQIATERRSADESSGRSRLGKRKHAPRSTASRSSSAPLTSS